MRNYPEERRQKCARSPPQDIELRGGQVETLLARSVPATLPVTQTRANQFGLSVAVIDRQSERPSQTKRPHLSRQHPNATHFSRIEEDGAVSATHGHDWQTPFTTAERLGGGSANDRSRREQRQDLKASRATSARGRARPERHDTDRYCLRRVFPRRASRVRIRRPEAGPRWSELGATST